LPVETPAPAPAPTPTPTPTPAPAATEPPPPQYQTLGKPEREEAEGDWDPWEHVRGNRHEGFFLRLSLGMGGGVIGGDAHVTRGSEVSASGLGMALDIAIGGALVENLILNADIFRAVLFNPSIEEDGNTIGDSDIEGDADDIGDAIGVGQDVSLAGLGIGLTYYIMPINLYLSGSIGLGQAVFEGDRGDVEGSDLGLGLNLMVGKEWWVGADWGIGLAGQFVYVAVEDDVLGDVSGLALSLLFSATYN
jgi:hypothetical protein